MKKVVKTLKQSLSILLAVAMVITCVPQTATMSLAASDADVIATDTDAAADENAAGVEVSTDDSADDSDTVSDEEPTLPADTDEQPDTTGDEIEVELTEGEEQEPELKLGTEVVEPDRDDGDIMPFSLQTMDVEYFSTYGSFTDIGRNIASNSFGTITDEGSEGYFFEAIVYDDFRLVKVTATVTGTVNGSEATDVLATDAEEEEKRITSEDAGEGYYKYTIPLNESALGNGLTKDNITNISVNFETEISGYRVSWSEESDCNAVIEFKSGIKELDDGETTITVAPGDEDITFAATPSDGYKVTNVYAEINGERTALQSANGVYTISTDLITEDTEEIYITVETTQIETVTVTFANYDQATSHYAIYQLNPVEVNGATKYAKADEAANGTITIEKGTTLYFAIEFANMYAVNTVKGSNVSIKPVTVTMQDDTSLKAYNISSSYTKNDQEVTITTQPDPESAYRAEFKTAEDGDSYYIISATGATKKNADIETIRSGRTIYTILDSITYTIKPYTGYQIEKIEKVEKVGDATTKTTIDESPEDPSTDSITITKEFSADDTSVTYEVTVKATPLTEERKVTFKNEASDLRLNVTTNEKVEAVDGEEGVYTLKEGAEYFEFTLETENPNITPKVVKERNNADDEDTDDEDEEDDTWWYSDTDESPYKYKVSASYFTEDTTLIIQQEGIPKRLIVAVDKDIEDWYSDGIVNWEEATAAVVGSDKVYYPDEPGVIIDTEDLEGLDGFDDGIYGVEFSIPIGSEVTVNIGAEDEFKIASYQILGDDGTSADVDAKTAEIPVTMEDNRVVILTITEDPTPYEIFLSKVSSGESVEAEDGVYSVTYGQEYAVWLQDKDEANPVLHKAELTLTDGGACATEITQTLRDGYDSELRFTIDAKDTGKTLLLKLWDNGEVYDDDTIEPCATLTLQVGASTAITKAAITGVSNGKLTQTVDTEQAYAITVEPAGADVNNLAAEIKWDDATNDEKEAFTAEVKDGSLVITTSTAMNAAAVDELNEAAQKATIGLVDTTAATDTFVEGSEFTLTIAAPTALTSLTPTLKLKSSDDVSLMLTLGVPTSAKLPELKEGKLWYAVTVSPQGSETELEEKGVKAETTYYVAKEDAATQDVRIFVTQNGAADAGKVSSCQFKVNAKVVQTKDATAMDDDEVTAETKATALTEFASKDATELTAATKDPYYATKLTLKKGTTTVYTGMEGVKIATINFGNNTTFTGNVQVADIASGDDNPIPEKAFEVNGTDVKITLNETTLRTDSEGYYKITPGKHTIRVTADAPDDTVAAYADLVITVNRGIEKLDLNYASDQIYKASNKAATLTGTPVYNEGATTASYAAKTKKVKDYVLVKAVKEEGEDEYSIAKDADDKDITIPNTSTLSVNAKTGKITVGKDFDPAQADGADKFFVRATSADWTDNTSGTSSSVYGYSQLITITDTAVITENNNIIVVREDWDQERWEPVYNTIFSTDQKSATSGDFYSYHPETWNEEEWEWERGLYAYAVVLKPGVEVKDSYTAEELVDSMVDPTYLTVKSSSKALQLSQDGEVQAVKTGTKIKITVSANDGSKASKILDKLEITNQKPEELGLKVESVQYNYETDAYGEKYYNTWTEEINRNAYETDDPIDFTGTVNSVLKLTVMRRDEYNPDNWYDMDELSDLKVTVSGAKILNKVSDYNQEYTIIANSAAAKVKLTYTGSNGKVTKTYTINNNGVSKTAGPKLKTSDKLVAGYYTGTQRITYKLSGTYNYSGKVVRLETDAADRSNSKKAENYAYLEKALATGEWTDVGDGEFELCFNNDGWDAVNEESGGTYIPAGSYKMVFTFGTLDADGTVIPDAKQVNVTLKATAPKKIKSSYKPVTSVKMSVYDTAAGVELKGTGKNIDYEEYYSWTLQNANTTGQANHFTQLFELDDNVLKLKSKFSDTLKTDLQKTGEIAKATAEDVTDADVVKYITEGTSKAAKNDRIGYVEYYAEGVYDPSTDDWATFAGTTKLTVTFNNKKSTDTYTLTNTTILQGTTTAEVQVLKNKKLAGDIADAYVTECTNSGVFEVTEITGGETQDTIVFKLDDTTKNTAKKYKVTVYVVPKNNYYATTIVGAKRNWKDLAAMGNPTEEVAASAIVLQESYETLIKTHGIKVTTTVTVADKSTAKNKISVTNTKPAFTNSYVGPMDWAGIESNYDGGNYWINIPYTTNLGADVCGIAYIESNDKKYVAPENAEDWQKDKTNLINFDKGIQDWDENRDDYGQRYINVTLGKEDLARAVEAGKVKYSTAKKKATITATATIYFTSDKEKDEEGNEIWEDVDGLPRYAYSIGDGDNYKTETIKFTITLPEAPEASGYDAAVAKVQDAKEAIAAAAVPADWIWNGETLLDTEAWEPDGNGNITLYTKNDIAIDALIYNVQEAIETLAPRDTDVEVRTAQIEWDERADCDRITLASTDFKAPTTTETGTLIVRENLYDVTTFDEEGNIILEDNGDIKKSTVTPIEFTVTIPELVEKPEDVHEAIINFIEEKEADADYIAALYLLEATGGSAYYEITKDARLAAGLIDADGKALNTLRLNLEDWDYREARVGEEGYIKGTLHVYGYRYGGEEVREDLEFTIPALKGIKDTAETVQTAVNNIPVTYKTEKAEILDAANAAILNPQYEAVWKTAAEDADDPLTDSDNNAVSDDDGDVYQKKDATRTADGSILGRILVVDKEDEEEPQQIDVRLTIARLSNSSEVTNAVRVAVGLSNSGSVDVVVEDTLKKLILEFDNDEAKVKAGILAKANAAVENDACTVVYRKDSTDTTKDLFDFTPASYKATGSVGDDDYNDGKGSISFTLDVYDAASDSDTVIVDGITMPAETAFGPYAELQTLEQAETDVTAALEDYKATIEAADSATGNAVDAEAVKTEAEEAVTGTGLDVVVDNFKKELATFKADGSISCNVVITKTVDESVVGTKTVTFGASIPKEVQSFETAVSVAQTALNNYNRVFTNADFVLATDETTTILKEEIVEDIEAAVKAVIDTDSFIVEIYKGDDDAVVVKAATVNEEGGFTIQVDIKENKTDSPQSKSITKSYTVDKLPQTADEAQQEAEKAIADYIAEHYPGGIDGTDNEAVEALNNTVVDEIKTAIEAVVKTDVYPLSDDAAFGNVAADADAGTPECYQATFTLTYTDDDGETQTITLTATIVVAEVTPANSVSANDSAW